ncbi:hypothetical protein M9458_026155, partial [Cirrhinus mrigala]
MEHAERRNCGCSCHMPQEPLEEFYRDLCLVPEEVQAVQHRLLMRHTVTLPKSEDFVLICSILEGKPEKRTVLRQNRDMK